MPASISQAHKCVPSHQWHQTIAVGSLWLGPGHGWLASAALKSMLDAAAQPCAGRRAFQIRGGDAVIGAAELAASRACPSLAKDMNSPLCIRLGKSVRMVVSHALVLGQLRAVLMLQMLLAWQARASKMQQASKILLWPRLPMCLRIPPHHSHARAAIQDKTRRLHLSQPTRLIRRLDSRQDKKITST